MATVSAGKQTETEEETDAVQADHPSAVSICAIDKKSVHRICSGQVVLTLATAVKELLENSIDAKATIVEIKLKDYGSESVEVSDNGIGVESSNFEGLTLKHHTSKIQDFGDLVNVETFGFRGEALSSLCALCDMVVTTRHQDVAVGTKLQFDNNGRITKRTPTARQMGTTVSLQNLFYTLPVRHKEFRRNLKKEFVKMVQVLNSYCIVSTGVRISCNNQTGKGSRTLVVSTNGNTTLQENISNVFGPKQMQSLLEFVQKSPGEEVCSEFGLKMQQPSMFSIDGYVSKCDHGSGRSSTDRQFYFINGRPFDSTKLSKVVNEVYHQYNRHQYPFVALRIQVEKESVDVNVTPDKRQVFLEREKQLLAIVKASLTTMYEPTTSVLQMQVPLAKFNMGSIKDKDEEDQQYTKISRHPSLEKPHGLSSLQKLKRSFSSAFAKDDSSSKMGSEAPKGDKSGSQTKQRKLDAFVSSNSYSPQKSDFQPSESPPQQLSQSEGESQDSGYCVIVSHKAAEHELSDTPITEHKTVKNENELSCEPKSKKNHNFSNNRSKVDETGDAKCVDVDIDLTKDDSVITDKKNTLKKNDDSNTVGTALKIELHEFKSEREENENSSGLSLIPHEHGQDLDIKEDTVDFKVLEQISENKLSDKSQTFIREINKESKDSDDGRIDHSSILLKEQDTSLSKFIQEENCFDETEVTEKRERNVTFSLKCLKEKMESKSNNKDGKFSRAFRAKICPGDNQAAEQELQKEIKKDMFSKMEILGQFNKGFIITRLEDDLFIVDQHATDEKFNFETLQRDTVIQSQKLICPQNLGLTASNEIILMDNLDTFRKNGFEFTIDENGQPTERVKLTSTPVSKNWHFGKEDIEEMLFMLSDSPGVMCRPTRVRAMFASRSCRKSVMIGTTLNKSEMKKLVCHMGEIEQPWNCPHGRPTMRHLINLDMVPR